MLRSIIPFKRLRHRALAALHAAMAEPGECKRISLPGENRIENAQPAQTGNLGQHAVDLQIHLIQRLLDMHDMFSRHLDQAAAMPPESTHGADHVRRPEAGSQQTDGVQVLKPLAAGYLRLSSWQTSGPRASRI